MEGSASSSTALIGLLAALGLQCSSKPIGDDDLFGEYSTERTLIVTGIGEPNDERCGVPQAPVSGQAALRYKVANEGGKVRVTELVGGCVLEARVEGDVVIADHQACSIGESAPLRQLGLTSRVYTVFRLDTTQKTVVSRATTVGTVTTGESHSCSVTEERIVDAPNGRAEQPASAVRVLYTGSLTTTVEQPEAETGCGREYVTSESSGYLSIDPAQLSARLDGFGCSIGLAEPSGAGFSANGQPCVPDGVVNFKGLGLDRLDIDSFSVNLSDKTASWRARAWRELATGRVSYCFNLTGSIEQR